MEIVAPMRPVRLIIFFIASLVSIPCFAFDEAGGVFLSLGSRDCQGCHDGVIAADVGRTHPIGVDYRMAQLKSRGKLKDVSQLDSNIQFEDGRVGCLSCHKPDSPIPAKLVTSNERSALCFSCHNL